MAAASASTKEACSRYVDLTPFVDMTGSLVLGGRRGEKLENVLGTQAGLKNSTSRHHITSDADEQLLFAIKFTAPVKVHSIRVGGTFGQDEDDVSGPRTVRVFAAKFVDDFSTAQDLSPTDELECDEEHLTLDGKELKLQFVKYQNIKMMSVFIQNTQNDTEYVRVGELTIIGTPTQGTNMNNLCKVG